MEYAASEVLRQLPICGHIFHTSCVDSWLQKQPTCPVCRILLSPKLSSEAATTAASPCPPATPSWVLVNRPVPLPPATTTPFSSAAASSSSICISTKASSSPTSDIEIGNNFHQGRMPLNGSSVEYPLLMKVAEQDLGSGSHLTVGGWGSSGFLDAAAVVSDNSCSKLQGGNRQQKSFRTSPGSCCTSNIQIQSRGIKNPSINSRRWLTESFSFVLSDTFNPDNVMQEHQLQLPGGGGADQAISIDNKSPTTTPVTTAAGARTKPYTDLRASSLPIMPMPSMGFSSSSSSRSSKKKKQMMLQQEGSMFCHSSPTDSESVFESRVSDSHLPLTISPEQCSFQFLPVLTMGSSHCADFSSFRPVATQH